MNNKLKLLSLTAEMSRLKILTMVNAGQSGHIGSSMSAIEFITYLCYKEIDYNSKERSKFILSKGHAAPALYATLNSLGFINNDELLTYRKINSRLQGHTNLNKIPETDFTSGLLGQGISFGVGSALAKKLKKNDNIVYVMVGDGELHEGQNWEAMMEASHYNLDNLVIIIDRNGLCSHLEVENVMSIEPLKEKLESFGWYVTEVNGHSISEIDSTVNMLKSIHGKPKCIISHTIKAKGVSFMENVGKWHRNIPNTIELNNAKKELEVKIAKLKLEEIII